MGISVSKTAQLAPISAVSSVIGFISFAFTLGTFVRVFWENIWTLFQAKSEIPVSCTLRRQLSLAKRQRSAAWVMQGVARAAKFRNGRTRALAQHGCANKRQDLLGNLKQSLYEERDHLRRLRKYCRHDAAEEASLELLYRAVKNMLKSFKTIEEPFILDNTVEKRPYSVHPGDAEDYYNTNYCEPSFYQRLIWIRRRGSVLAMFEKLARIQTRRIARGMVEVRL